MVNRVMRGGPSGRYVGAGLAAIVALSGAAAARPDICQVFRAGVPDFDQKRSDLPNDGKMYCVPASWINWMGFLQNNGYDGLMFPVYGTWNWQSGDWYDVVTLRIKDLGDRMGTDPIDGTSLEMGDVVEYVADFTSPNPYMVGLKYTTEPQWMMNGPAPTVAANQLLMGGMVNLHISWFKRHDGYYKRNGGHSVSCTGVTGLCGGPVHVRYRDPSSSDGWSSQSEFTTTDTATHAVADWFQWDDQTTSYFGVLHQLDGYDGQTKGFLTGISVLMVNFGVGIESTTGKLKLLRPLNFTRELLPAVQYLDVGPGVVSELQFLPDMTRALAVVNGASRQVVLLDLATGEHKPFAPVDTAGPLAVGRLGEVFYCDGSVLKSLDPVNGKVIDKAAIENPLVHLAYDDAMDELVGIDPSRRRVQQYDRRLDLTYDRPLPAGVVPGEESSMAIHPITRQLWISMGDGSVFEVSRPRSGDPAAQRFTLPGVTRCHSLQFLPDGAMTVLCDGSVREFRFDDAGKLVRANLTGFDGAAFDGVFRLIQSKDNTAAWMVDVPERDVEPPAERPAGTADCAADYDQSGFVDTDDFTAFVLDFEAGLQRSDVDYSGFVDTDDFTYFVLAFEKGC